MRCSYCKSLMNPRVVEGDYPEGLPYWVCTNRHCRSVSYTNTARSVRAYTGYSAILSPRYLGKGFNNLVHIILREDYTE